MAISSLLIQPLWKRSADAVVVTTFEHDPAKRLILYSNPAFTKLTGFPAADVIGKLAAICDGEKTDQAILHAACRGNIGVTFADSMPADFDLE